MFHQKGTLTNEKTVPCDGVGNTMTAWISFAEELNLTPPGSRITSLRRIAIGQRNKTGRTQHGRRSGTHERCPRACL